MILKLTYMRHYIDDRAAFVEFLENHLLNVQIVAESIGVSRNRFYEWLKADGQVPTVANLRRLETFLKEYLRERYDKDVIFGREDGRVYFDVSEVSKEDGSLENQKFRQEVWKILAATPDAQIKDLYEAFTAALKEIRKDKGEVGNAPQGKTNGKNRGGY